MHSPIALPEGALEAAAKSCRVALRALLEMPPDPSALNAWLGGPYREALAFGSPRVSVLFTYPTVTASELAELQAYARKLLAVAIAPRDADELAGLLPQRLLAARAVDDGGRSGFVLLQGRAPLRDRVAAVVMVDYLSRQPDGSSSVAQLTGGQAVAPPRRPSTQREVPAAKRAARAARPTLPDLRRAPPRGRS